MYAASQREDQIDVNKATYILTAIRVAKPDITEMELKKSSESVQCAITGPCLSMRHRPSA